MMKFSPPLYHGRFAPSPTGPLHFGSLLAAVGSYLRAKNQNGQWLVRIEDIDPPREVAGASDAILRCLETYGFEWDGQVLYQHGRLDAYQTALEYLMKTGQAFHCSCSRKELEGHRIYPGVCRPGLSAGKSPRAIRVRVEQDTLGFTDGIQSDYQQDLSTEVGDFVIKRADGFFAYQLAVVVDDADQGITEVVRGCDLLDNTPRQIYLQRLLGLPTPAYIHLPVATNSRGEKLSKQTYARALDLTKPALSLVKALSFLGQQPPADLQYANLQEVWRWAMTHWSLERVPHQRAIILETAIDRFVDGLSL